MSREHRSSTMPLAVAGLLLIGCSQAPVTDPLSDGVMGTFVAAGDTFKVWITNDQAWNDIVAVWEGRSDKSIPDGTLNLGSGPLGYNVPWSWHIDPDDVQMIETASDECDAAPSEVQANLEQWINDMGRFCPSGSQLVFLESL